MKVIILCGGKGTRLSQETRLIPKPMVKIGGKPILDHIIEIYESYGFSDFILALGHKSHIIKNYYGRKKKRNVRLVYTGKDTLTGGRLLRLKKFFKPNENFMLTYGDGLSNQNLKKLANYHIKHKKIATITAVRPQLRFGELIIDNINVKKFKEKPQSETGWVNGGFLVFNYKIFNFLKGDMEMLERKPLEKLVKKKQLIAFKHKGFWHCMDTLRDKLFLEDLIKIKKKVPWKI